MFPTMTVFSGIVIDEAPAFSTTYKNPWHDRDGWEPFIKTVTFKNLYHWDATHFFWNIYFP